jgi:hypothetical protein
LIRAGSIEGFWFVAVDVVTGFFSSFGSGFGRVAVIW